MHGGMHRPRARCFCKRTAADHTKTRQEPGAPRVCGPKAMLLGVVHSAPMAPAVSKCLVIRALRHPGAGQVVCGWLLAEGAARVNLPVVRGLGARAWCIARFKLRERSIRGAKKSEGERG